MGTVVAVSYSKARKDAKAWSGLRNGGSSFSLIEDWYIGQVRWGEGLEVTDSLRRSEVYW